ncbi:hypothetical protein NDU88_006404 [Pleurodeles waltl]|uniref:Uncharacterized protein n=1 Tax=Pleurodeles waltl TaxID=8319 RepID=A0AAV7X0N2_PLEWA|nr:hypothetical protein NDU88_006404 [Pleurodeles waltl]
MASWFLVGCREVSGFRSKDCFHCAFDGVGTAPEKVADWCLVIQWAVHCFPSVGGYCCGVCFYRCGGQSVKVAVCVGGFRHVRDSIFFTVGLLAEDGAMAENRRQGQCSGTASKKSGGHQEEVERPMGEGPIPNVTRQEVPDISSPPTEEAHSDDSSSARLDQDNQPGPSGTSGKSVPLPLSQTTTEPPPSGNTTTAPTQRAHPIVPRTHQSAVCPPLQGTQAKPPTQENQGPGVSGHMVQGTEAQANREAGRTAVRQGEDRPREPTLHKALSNIMGAYHHSQETMGTVLAKFQETQQLQEEHYLGIREDFKSINNTLVTIAGVLADLVNTMRNTQTDP